LADPMLLPSQNWNPRSDWARWIGLAMDRTAELILLLVLLGLPFCVYLSIRTGQSRFRSLPFATDLIFCLSVYGAAYFLLAPPGVMR
jgi:hypothetical protein